jgi:aryl-alcohol dehydrogenase-like predicted oxidoreductase
MPAGRAGAEIGLGLAALGRPGYINLGHGRDVEDVAVGRMERAAHDVLDAAYQEGVRAFDAARSYGRAEAFLASWLERRELKPGDVQVSSKWGYTYTAGWRVDAEEHEVKDLTATQLRRQWRETRELLGDHVRLYQIHSATVESGVLEDLEVHAELAALRESGVRIGLTVTGPRQAETIERALATGAFQAVQATWNLHERSAARALAGASEAGLYVMVKEALANGRLTARGADPELRRAAEDRDTTEDALALSAALAQPWADLVLSGAATVGQLRSNLAARELAWADELERRLAGLVEEPAAYWAARAELPWN